MTKKTITKINACNWERLQEIEGGTIDRKLNKLMDIIESEMPFVEFNTEMKSINVYTDTLERLDGFHLTMSESRDNILTRMFIALDEINNTSNEVEEYISFKLINPYNNLLVLEGQIEYNSNVITFNHRGYVYLGKLPKEYIVDGKDLTKELYIWYDNLDWNRITNLLLKNVDEQTIIEDKDFILEINNVMG